MRHAFIVLATILVTAVPFSGPQLAQVGTRQSGTGSQDLTSDIALGRRLSSQLEQNSLLIQDPAVAEYVNRLGQTLVRNSGAKVPFEFRVIDSKDVSMPSLPGGFVFVTTGLILAADTEAELAGLIGHAVAHVVGRHAAKQPDRDWIVNTLPVPSIVVGDTPREVLKDAATLGLPLAVLRYSQPLEQEADWLGLQYAYKSGYDPRALASFFLKLEARRSMGIAAFPLFQTHQQTPERIETNRKSVETFLAPRAQDITDTVEFHAIQARLVSR